jgi:hypothetical protein
MVARENPITTFDLTVDFPAISPYVFTLIPDLDTIRTQIGPTFSADSEHCTSTASQCDPQLNVLSVYSL